MSEDEALSEPFRLADAAFREFAEMTAANEGGTFEQAHKATWRLYELWISEAGGRGRSPPRPGVHNPGGAACCRQAEPAIGRLLAADSALEPNGTGAGKPARTKQPLEPDRGRAGWIE